MFLKVKSDNIGFVTAFVTLICDSACKVFTEALIPTLAGNCDS